MTMRTTEQQLQEIMKRAEILRENRAQKKRVLIDAISVLCCLVLLVGASVTLPRLDTAADQSVSQHYGSLILGASYIGYVVIGVFAFALGVCVTLLCLHWKKLKQKERDRQ